MTDEPTNGDDEGGDVRLSLLVPAIVHDFVLEEIGQGYRLRSRVSVSEFYRRLIALGIVNYDRNAVLQLEMDR